MSAAASKALLTVGLDVGSSAVKGVVLRENGAGSGRMLSGLTERIRRRDLKQVAQAVFQEILRQAEVAEEDLDYVATTGEGEVAAFRTGHFYGMTAHARGALFLDPEARAIIDIGALHARAVLMDERAKVLAYRMTSQCASGSGQFIENIGRYLGVTLEEVGSLSLQSDEPETCSSICAVLAETDVINMVSRGISIPNILKGIHVSMAGRYMRLLASSGAQGRVLITGGLARDVGLLAALREAAGEHKGDLQIEMHEHSQLAGALGAALWGAFRFRKLRAQGVSLEAR